MCEDLCVLGLVEYKRCLYYENGKKVIEARWRGNPIILKSKLENFSSYEPLGILDYQVMSALCVQSVIYAAAFVIMNLLCSAQQDTAEELSPLDVVFYATLEVRQLADRASTEFTLMFVVCTVTKSRLFQSLQSIFTCSDLRYETLWGWLKRMRMKKEEERTARWPDSGGRS